MSNPILCPNVKKHIKVIVRAYGDEPVQLQARKGDENAIEVVGNEPDKSISFPSQYVYQFNPELFNRLKVAFNGNNQKHLTMLWKEAKQYVWNM